MRYETYTIEVLKELGIYKKYKGCAYIVSCINYIYKNEKEFLPITKILYVDIAKKHNTSGRCVERDMRNVITNIWQQKKNEKLMCEIFGECNMKKRPTNMEFLMLLYNHVKYKKDKIYAVNKDIEQYEITCPLTGEKCKSCNEAIEKILKEIYN